jgi:hypothetical protein
MTHGVDRERSTTEPEIADIAPEDVRPGVTIVVGSRAEKRELERAIEAAGGADGQMAMATVPMPPELLAIMRHWRSLGDDGVLFMKFIQSPAFAVAEIRVIAIRMPAEIARQI